MEAKIALNPEIVTVTSEPRPTPRPSTSFSEVMARSAGTLVGGAESAITSLPGTSLVALAVRGGASPSLPVAPLPLGGLGLPGAGGVGGGAAEGPGAASSSVGSQFLSSMTSAASGDGGAAASLQQSAQSNLYYLQLQQQVSQQSQTFEALSNVLKSESDTVKNAIGNMH